MTPPVTIPHCRIGKVEFKPVIDGDVAKAMREVAAVLDYWQREKDAARNKRRVTIAKDWPNLIWWDRLELLENCP